MKKDPYLSELDEKYKSGEINLMTGESMTGLSGNINIAAGASAIGGGQI